MANVLKQAYFHDEELRLVKEGVGLSRRRNPLPIAAS